MFAVARLIVGGSPPWLTPVQEVPPDVATLVACARNEPQASLLDKMPAFTSSLARSSLRLRHPAHRGSDIWATK